MLLTEIKYRPQNKKPGFCSPIKRIHPTNGTVERVVKINKSQTCRSGKAREHNRHRVATHGKTGKEEYRKAKNEYRYGLYQPDIGLGPRHRHETIDVNQTPQGGQGHVDALDPQQFPVKSFEMHGVKAAIAIPGYLVSGT